MSPNNTANQIHFGTTQHECMSWVSLLSQARLYPKSDTVSHERSAFEVDYDRLIFSKAFRRLARKTQVHPQAANDHTHNRLTHSLEVASVGRSLGKRAYSIAQQYEKQPMPSSAVEFGELVQAACLAHDIGNTPFGHAGERSIREWMNEHPEHLSTLTEAQRSDLALYEGNAQAFRIATRSVSEFEQGCINRQGGLGLSAATLSTMMKYPWGSDNAYAKSHGKYSVFQDDKIAFDWVVATTGLLKKDGVYCRHPLTFLVEAADDVCNAIIDIEDAIDLHILQRKDVETSLVHLSGLSANHTVAQMRAKAIGLLIDQCLQVFSEHYLEIMLGEFQQPLIMCIEQKQLDAFNQLNEIAKNSVYPFQRDDALERNCNTVFSRILDKALSYNDGIALNHYDAVTTPFAEVLGKIVEMPSTDYEKIMMTMDFVAGMTDNYAANLADRLALETPP